jgi:NAD-dependent deacetylase
MLQRGGVTLVTQNVDGLHELAAREESVEGEHTRAMPTRLHGSIFAVRCTRCRYHAEDRTAFAMTGNAPLPCCPSCGGLLRPDVVWFGEPLPPAELQTAEEAARSAEVCLVIGTRGAVYPAAGLVFQAREQAGARIIVVDPGETSFDGMAEVRIGAPAGEAIPRLLQYQAPSSK